MIPAFAGLAAFGTKVGSVLVANAPQILTGGGIISILAGGALLIKDTPGYIDILEEAKKGKISRAEAAKQIIPKAAKAGLLIISGIIWIGVAQKISLDRAMAAAACSAVTTKELKGLKAWKKEAEKVMGTEKSKEVTRAAKSKSKDVEDRDLDVERRRGMMTSKCIKGGGPWVACYEVMTNTPFKIRLGALTNAIGEANGILYSELMLDLNQWLDCLGLEHVPNGEKICIHSDSVGRNGLQFVEGSCRMDWDGIHALRDVQIANVTWEESFRAAR